MPSLAELRGRASSIADLQSKVSTNKYKKDERFWLATRDKQKNANTVIRFLPQANLDDSPFVKFHSHFFQGNDGKYFVEKCPNTNDDPCPVCENNNGYWNRAKELSKGNGEKPRDLVPDHIHSRGRKTAFVSNILVIKDPANPENEGKVFLFQYGVAIFKMLKECIQPTFEGEVAFDPFSLFEGADFNFKITDKGGNANYDKSQFLQPSEACGGDEKKLNEVAENLISLDEFYYKDEIKTYEALQKKFNDVTGEGTLDERASMPADAPSLDEDEQEDDLNSIMTEEKVEDNVDDLLSGDDDDDDDFENYFKS